MNVPWNWYPLGAKNVPSHTNQNRYLVPLGVLFKISNKHPSAFNMGITPLTQGINLSWTSIPSRGSSNTSSHFML